jgi:single-strand DNA-binding protein
LPEHPFYHIFQGERHKMLRVTFTGNLGADPELRYTAKGTQVLSFNVAVNQVRFGPDGERQENTEWFRVKVTGRQVDFVQQRVGKGARVLVIGRLDIGHYQAKDGEQRTSFDVWADEVQSMSAQRQEAAEVEQESAEPALVGAAAASASNGRGRGARPARATSEDLEDLPF